MNCSSFTLTPARYLAGVPYNACLNPNQQGNLASHEGFDVMTPELKRLQGKWVATSITKDGMALPGSSANREGVWLVAT
jgi:hypothetical protein